MSFLTEVDIADRAHTYTAVKFRTPRVGLGETHSYVRYPFKGDTVYINRVSGSGALQIKLGKRNNPWINIAEGMTLRREFDQLFIRDVHGYTALDTPAELEAYVSFGDFIRRDFKSHGAKNVIGLRNLSATTVPKDLSQFALISRGTPVHFDGGFLVIKNTDAANTLIFGGSGIGTVLADNGFPLSPGETMGFDVSSKLSPFGLSATASVATPAELCFWCDAGTCAFALLFSHLTRNRTDVDFVAGTGGWGTPLPLED